MSMVTGRQEERNEGEEEEEGKEKVVVCGRHSSSMHVSCTIPRGAPVHVQRSQEARAGARGARFLVHLLATIVRHSTWCGLFHHIRHRTSLTSSSIVMASPPCSHGYPSSLSRRRQNQYEGAVLKHYDILAELTPGDHPREIRYNTKLFLNRTVEFLLSRAHLLEKSFLEYLKSKSVTKTLLFCSALPDAQVGSKRNSPHLPHHSS